MSKRYSKELLWRIRNKIPMRAVIAFLRVPWKKDIQLTRFLCPICKSFNTSIHYQVNLGHCFDCNENFNPIDFVEKHQKFNFRETIDYLLRILPIVDNDDFNIAVNKLLRQSQCNG